MIERVDVVRYGRPASEALAAAVSRAKASGPLAPVTVIVPSNLAGLTARRLLGAGLVGAGGIANVSFVTPFRLAELLAADRVLDRRPLTNPVLGAAVRLALADDPGPFAQVADHHATVSTLASLYAELSNVAPTTLDRLERDGGASARTAVRFHRAIRGHLGAFHDEAAIAGAAATRPDLGAAVVPLGSVVWFLPAQTTAPLLRLIAAVAVAAPFHAVVGLTGNGDADAAVLAACTAAGVDVAVSSEAPAFAAPVADAIVSVTDADEEVRAVVRRVAALAEAGVALDRIGVFHPVADPYVGAFEHAFAAAGIPANGSSRRRLADSVAGRTLLDALALPSTRWRRDRVMALVSGGPVRHGDGRAHPTAWERLSREAGIIHDLSDWHRKLDLRAASIDERIARLDPVEQERAVAHFQRERDDVQQLRDFVDNLAGAVRAVERAESWATKSQAALALLHQLLGGGHLHTRWPEPEQQSFERVEDALTRLATLDELEPNPTHAVFVRALSAELDVTRGRTERFGHGVFYGPLSSAVGQDFDAVFVVGCTEGLCPSPRRADAMLPDAARALAPGELEQRGARLHDQHRQFLAALASAPPDRRTLVFPRSDLRGGRRASPSRWLLDSATALAGAPVYATDFAELGPPVIDVVSSHATGVRNAAIPGDLVERDLSAILRYVDAGGAAAEHPASTTVARGLDLQAKRRSPAFTEYDGNLAGQPIETNAERAMSPTRLETWAACGFRYLLGYELGFGDRDEPERVLDLNPLDRGSAVHEVLERFLIEVIDGGAPGPHEPWSHAQRARLYEIATEVFRRYEGWGRTGRPVHWRLMRDDLFALLDGFLNADDAYREQTRSRPERVELPFGLDGHDPVVLTLPDGRTLAFRGKADRVDRTEDGRLLVSDYKTGKGDKYQKIDVDDPVAGGTTLQLGLYAEAAIQHLGADAASATYWMVDPRANFSRYGYDWTPERRRRFLDVATAIIDGIEQGVFLALPGEWDTWRNTHDNCTWCEFDAVCPRDRGEQSDAKVTAVQLRVRDALVWEAAE